MRSPAWTSDSDSEGEVFVIPQFDGANDIVSHRGRRQHQHPPPPPQHHHHRPVAASTRDIVRENALKRSQGGAHRGAPAPRPHQPPSVPSSHHHHPVPSPIGSSHHTPLLNPDSTLVLPDFMDISSSLATGEVQSSSFVPQAMRAKSSRREFPPPQDVQHPPPPLNITPLPGMGMSQRVPGIGDALVVPALVTTGRVSLTSPQMLVSQGYVQQQPTPAPDLAPGPGPCPGPSPAQPASHNHRQSRRAAVGEGQRSLAHRTLARQDSEQSAYSPISEESDGEGGSRGRRGRGVGEGRAADPPVSAAPKNEDILKQAFDMTLSDLGDEPMDVETPEFALMPSEYTADGCPLGSQEMLASNSYLYQAEDGSTMQLTPIAATQTHGDVNQSEAPHAPPTPSPPPPIPRKELPAPATKTKKKKQKPGREKNNAG